MRLTLRTLLAYMDRILEPKDAEDLRTKIEDSEYASQLMQRIGDVVRRLRMAAPGVSDRGPGLDPNTVAEYLDNSLSDERLPDFEKVCLEAGAEADMHLAEVASCHQILTKVLGEPAEIDPATRQRMYEIPLLPPAPKAAVAAHPAQVVAPAAGKPPLAGRGPAAERERAAERPAAEKPAAEKPTAEKRSDGQQPSPIPRQKPTVPDYLREPGKKRRLLPIAAALLLLVAFAVLVLTALGQFRPGTPLGNLLGMRLENGDLTGKPEAAKNPPPAPEEKPAEKPTEQPPTGQPPVEEPLDKGTKPPEPGPAPLPEVGPGSKSVPTPPEGQTPPGPKPPGEPPAEPAAKPEKPPAEPQPPEPRPEPPGEPAKAIGRLMSSRQVLLAYAAETSEWHRVPVKGILVPQTRLLALPTYRPEIALGAGVTIQLFGGSQIEWLSGDGQAGGGLKVFFGRMVLMPTANPGAKLHLIVGPKSGIVTFAQAESVAALEVNLIRTPGTDPEKEPSSVTATLYAATGDVIWEEIGGIQPTRLTAPARLSINGQPARSPGAVENLPKWLDPETIGLLDARGATILEQNLTVDRSAAPKLLEFVDDPRREVRWLARRCLAYLGQFQPMVAVLKQPELKQEWPEYVDKLREAIARGPEMAAAVRTALEREYEKDAPDLYRMLWGYSDQQLQSGEDAKLVKLLEHDSLPFRVLSYRNLRELTGLGYFYGPADPPAKRVLPVQRWKERLAAGDIRHRTGAATPTETEPTTGGPNGPL